MSRSVIQDYREGNCYLCNLLDKNWTPAVNEHHIFNGPLRNKSEHYGLKVRLCFEHHGKKGDKDVHRPDRNDYGLLLKAIGQRAFENRYGYKRFMNEFGKDYIAKYLNFGPGKK